MTTHEIGQRAPSRHARRKRRRNYGPVIILALVCAAIFAAGYCVGVSAADKAVPTLPEPVLESTATPEPSAEPSVAPTPSPTPEAVLWRDDIVTDGNLLDYDLQVTMQACCEEYGVPYALALAVADVESRFDPDAASSTNDYGLMQINQVNHGWLLEQGIDPMTPAGNIEAGVLFLSDYLTAYGDPELAVMAYDDVGKLTLKNIGSMKLGLLIDEDTAGDFDYKSSIASQTYDKIKLSYENKDTGKREIFVAQDSSNINQWGVLQYYEKLDSTTNAKAMADALLSLYNTKTRTLKLQDVLGDIRVRAGTLLVVMLGLGDINVSNYLMVEQVKHTFNNEQHLMELKMRGGTFVT